MTTRVLRLLAASVFVLLVLPVAAQLTVYRCETNGKVAYSDARCVGADTLGE
ncbi:DUF4124 domain-containing protein [Variovorax sp. LT1P1]|uniref:DUF4124 domain-containing protein n=1 Tax=Variovorax sp. LT1P1 TaxID=3443730 RepID=UPI003F457467